MYNEIQTLASLYHEKKLNQMVFDANIIPKDTYEKVALEITQYIDKLEKTCYINKRNVYNMVGESNGFIKNAKRA